MNAAQTVYSIDDEHLNTDVRSRAEVIYDLFGSDTDDESHSEGVNGQFWNDVCNGDEGTSSLNDGFYNFGSNGQENLHVEAPTSNDDVTGQENVHFEAPQKEYARQTGFSVLKRGLKNSKYALMACDKSRVPITQNRSKRIGCPARLNAIRKDDGFWVISKTVMEHNHDLDPTMSILMPAHRKINVHMKRQLEANDIAGIRPSKNIRLCEVQAGGPNKIGCIPRDCRNFIDNRRRFRLGVGDGEAIRKLFARLQHRDRIFFHLIDIDDEGRLRNVLWIHPRSRAAYEYFNDVVSFDTTYLVNRHIFWSGMLFTQRSEGMHAYFDDYMHSRCSLKEFMEQYEVAIGKKIQKEFIVDFESKNKEEIDRMVYCHIVPAPENDDDGVVDDVVQKFYVLDRSRRNNFRPEFTYKVEYRADGEYLNCQCHGFEFRGLLCCHILTVMTMKDIRSINERYILTRWRKDVYMRHSSIFFEGGYPYMTEEYKRYQQVEKKNQECVDTAIGSSQHMDKLIELKNEFLSSNNAGKEDLDRIVSEINLRRSRATRARTTNGTMNDPVVRGEVDISLTL
ncbi:hypothetical protein ACS0TY_003693 [Phlomoides rotata]